MSLRSAQASGLTVVEYVGGGSGIAVAYAGWLLGQMGAQVSRLEAPELEGRAPSNPMDYALQSLAQGKRTFADARTARDVEMLVREADILLCDTPALEALDTSAATLHEQCTGLTIGVATVFGLDGPYAEVPATGLDAQALSGVAWAMGERGRAPLSVPPGILEHQAGALLASGCLLGVLARDDIGHGQVVDVALADVLASYVAGNCRFLIHHGLEWSRSGRRASGSGGAYPYMLLPCKDGDVCICGRTREEWNRLVAAMGNPDWAQLPRYQNLRAMGKEYPEEVDALVLPWLAEHTKAELEAIALRHNLIVSPIREFTEVLATPHFSQSGFFAAHGDVKVPSLPFKATECRSENTSNIASQLLCSTGARAGTDALKPMPGRPLAGLRVLDLGWVWSAPWVSTFLGELGAQVIKVEHAARPDNLRLAGRVFRDGQRVEGPSKEMSPMFHQVNHGKYGVTLNLKAPRARELLCELITKSDVVVENMSPGSLERNELGYDTFREHNRSIVMVAMSAAGQFGALADMRAYAPTMSSFVGLEALMGYRGEAPIGALNFGLSDPNASVHGLVALMAALHRARDTGVGCYIDLSQIESLLGTLRPYLLDAQMNSHQPPPLGNAHFAMAPHGIYPAREENAWLTLAVQDDAGWQALCQIARSEAWSNDSRYETLADRLTHRDALDVQLGAWTQQHARDSLVETLRRAGIASSPVLGVEEAWSHEHYRARHLTQRVDIPIYGSEVLFKAPWLFTDFEPEIDRCGPSTGEHNEFVFGELLGLSSDEIAHLTSTEVIA